LEGSQFPSGCDGEKLDFLQGGKKVRGFKNRIPRVMRKNPGGTYLSPKEETNNN